MLTISAADKIAAPGTTRPTLRTTSASFALPASTAEAPTGQATRSTASGDTAVPAKIEDALAAFMKEARMTPQQRIRRDVLKQNDLTEEDLAAMSPADRKAIEAKIAPEVARRVKLAEEEAKRQGKTASLPSM